MTDPAPPYKGSLLLSVLRSPYGWTESLWINRGSFDASLAALQEVAVGRLAILPKAFSLGRIKVTNPLLPRAVADRHVNERGGYDCDARPVWSTLLLRFQHEGYNTRYNLGGVPADAVSGAGVHPTEAWQAAFRGFEAAVKRHCVMVNEGLKRCMSVPGTPAVVSQEHSVMKITAAEDFFGEAHREARVILSGAVAQPSLNGVHEVWVRDARNAATTRAMTVAPEAAAAPVTIHWYEKLMNPISKVAILRLASHKRGMGHSYPPPGRRGPR